MDAVELLAYGTSHGIFGVLEIQKEDGVVHTNHITTVSLLDVFEHFDLSLTDMKVYWIEFINNASRLLVGTSHGMLSVPSRNVDITKDCMWTNMTEEALACPKLVIGHDHKAITIQRTFLNVWRITSDGLLSGPWLLSPPTEGEISCLETNIVQDLGLGRENGFVEAWHLGSVLHGPEHTLYQQTGEHKVVALALSKSCVCAVNNNNEMFVMNWLEGEDEELRTVDIEGFDPMFCLFPQRDACWSEKILPVVLIDGKYAFCYDVNGIRPEYVILIDDPGDSLTCYARDGDDFYFGTDMGAIKHFSLNEGDLNLDAEGVVIHTFNVPHVYGSITSIALSANALWVEDEINENVRSFANEQGMLPVALPVAVV